MPDAVSLGDPGKKKLGLVSQRDLDVARFRPMVPAKGS